jgi:PadR family transcriptional regulator
LPVPRIRRPSAQTVAVLDAFLDDPGTWRYGYQLGLEIGLAAGSLYPILMRLTDRGLLEARWEPAPTDGRPPRHLYRLTGTGVTFSRALRATAAPASPRPVHRLVLEGL